MLHNPFLRFHKIIYFRLAFCKNVIWFEELFPVMINEFLRQLLDLLKRNFAHDSLEHIDLK